MPIENKRIDTSGFDLDINSPYDANRMMNVPPAINGVKLHKIQSEDLSKTATVETSSDAEEDKAERNDEIKDLIEME